MKYLKKFDVFLEIAAAPATKPAPTTKPAKPATKPTTTPQKPSPIRRDRPGVEPAPQALKTAEIDDVVKEFLNISREKNFDFKKYFPKV